MRKQIWFVVLALLLVGMACSFGASSETQGDAPTGNTGASTQAPAPTDSPVLFQDDFSSTSSGWDRSTYDDGSQTDYVDGGYHILVNGEYASVWANPGIDVADVSVEVDGVKRGGVDDNEFGVICRYQDESNFYAGSISSDGFYAIVKIQDGEFGYVGTEGMQPSDLILLGDQVNRVRLDCVGSMLTLYVNGTQLISGNDSSFGSGDVGLYAGTFATPGIDVFFDNFVANRP
ncbi:MAG: hypothetical protein KIT08_03670 [Anaerolineales bacterium]|nr:MAG: hypothetical protein KIT08_03670 [Anaerolineales bacterium]